MLAASTNTRPPVMAMPMIRPPQTSAPADNAQMRITLTEAPTTALAMNHRMRVIGRALMSRAYSWAPASAPIANRNLFRRRADGLGQECVLG